MKIRRDAWHCRYWVWLRKIWGMDWEFSHSRYPPWYYRPPEATNLCWYCQQMFWLTGILVLLSPWLLLMFPLHLLWRKTGWDQQLGFDFHHDDDLTFHSHGDVAVCLSAFVPIFTGLWSILVHIFKLGGWILCAIGVVALLIYLSYWVFQWAYWVVVIQTFWLVTGVGSLVLAAVVPYGIYQAKGYICPLIEFTDPKTKDKE